MNTIAFLGALGTGLIFSLMAMGLSISFRVLNVADLTTEGSFGFGAAVSAVLTAAGYPYLGLLLGCIAGMSSGFVTAFLQTKMKIQPILAGILTTGGLYSIIYMVMGKPNVPLLTSSTVYSGMAAWLPLDSGAQARYIAQIIVSALVVILAVFFLTIFFKTQLGLSVRATGDNENMVRSSSINADYTKTLGLIMANGLVALSGALFSQSLGMAEVNMGVGMVVVGLASLIIGEVVFGKSTILKNLLASVFGSIIYRLIVTMVYQSEAQTQNIKLISALIVVIALSYPAAKEYIALTKKRRQGGEQDASHR